MCGAVVHVRDKLTGPKEREFGIGDWVAIDVIARLATVADNKGLLEEVKVCALRIFHDDSADEWVNPLGCVKREAPRVVYGTERCANVLEETLQRSKTVILSALGPRKNLVGGRMDASVPGDSRFAGADSDDVDHPPSVPVRVEGALNVVQAVKRPVLPRVAVNVRAFDRNVGEEVAGAIRSGQMLSVSGGASFF